MSPLPNIPTGLQVQAACAVSAATPPVVTDPVNIVSVTRTGAGTWVVTMREPIIRSQRKVILTPDNAAFGSVQLDPAFQTDRTIGVLGMGAAGVGGALQYIDTIGPLAAPTTSVDFGAGGDGNLGTALNGNVDEVYILETDWVPAAAVLANTRISLNPNGLGTNQNGNAAFWTAASVVRRQYLNDMALHNAAAYSVRIVGSFEFRAATNKKRLLLGQDTETIAGVVTNGSAVAGVWNETATNITSLRLLCSAANGIAAGSEFRLYKRVESNAVAPIATDLAFQIAVYRVSGVV
jgi:hypothetical protein